ncbi:MAG: SMP-30/gluconolactonase/LRE family protein [Parvularcula sp.]
MRLLTPFVYLIGIGAVIAIGLIGWTGLSFRQFENVEPGGSLTACTPVIGIDGASDIVRVPETQFVFISSFDRRGRAERGEILRFNIEDPLDDRSWRDRTGGQPALLEPAGLDIYHAPLPDGRWLTRLFVVNRAGPEILLYDIDAAGDLVLRERFSDPRLTSPNDVVATGPRSFYVTNETAAPTHSWKRRIDFFLGLKTGQILEFDGSSWADVVDGLSFPNGLALSPDGRRLVLAEMRSQHLKAFDRNPRTDILEQAQTIPLEGFPDNMSFDPDGHLVVASVPQPLTFTAYGKGLNDLAPSVVLRVAPSGLVETLFSDPGERLSAATVGVAVDDKLLIGSYAADRFLMCDVGDE